MPADTGTRPGSILDLARLCEISGNDAGTMCEVIDVFLEHAPTLVRELQDQHAAHDGNGLRRVAHKLKPMFAYVGMTSIHARALQLEQIDAGAVNWEDCTDLVKSITADFEPARQALIAYRATLSGH